MVIGLDFDGTVVTHDYPKIGKDIGAVPVLKRLIAAGHKLMLWTMRDNKELDEAVQWFKDRGIELFGINKNPTQYWSTSNKQYARIYIDDSALGAPLTMDKSLSPHPYIDWGAVAEYFELSEII